MKILGFHIRYIISQQFWLIRKMSWRCCGKYEKEIAQLELLCKLDPNLLKMDENPRKYVKLLQRYELFLHQLSNYDYLVKSSQPLFLPQLSEEVVITELSQRLNPELQYLVEFMEQVTSVFTDISSVCNFYMDPIVDLSADLRCYHRIQNFQRTRILELLTASDKITDQLMAEVLTHVSIPIARTSTITNSPKRPRSRSN